MTYRKLPNRKAKIVATLGPASSSRETIRAMIDAGMNVARMNFSHGEHSEHLEKLNYVREEAEKAGRHVAVFQDLCGPKVRIGDVEGGSVKLIDGHEIALRAYTGAKGDSSTLFVQAFDPAKVMARGERALLSDGKIELIAKDVKDDAVICTIKAGGELRSRSGIAVPESKLNLPCLTEKDKKDLEFAFEHNLDFVALSFVATAQDVLYLKSLMKDRGLSIPVISKVERATSLDHIESIVSASDAVMVARGDLGLELPLEKVPGAQRLIIKTANMASTPVITATQMLVSMVEEVRPTRAEVTDVHTAVRDGTDAVMLSEETAIGKHPALAIEVLDNIVRAAEDEIAHERKDRGFIATDDETVADSICYAASRAADKIQAKAILACTLSGHTAKLLSRYRPREMLFGVTPDPKALSRMALYWGVEPVLMQINESFSTEEEVLNAMRSVRDKYGFKPGTRVVLTAGLRAKKSGSTTLLEIREIPRD